MGQLSQRIFAASGAILFFFTSVALSIVVIITLVQDSHKKPAATTAAATCEATGTETALPAPEAYTTPDKVTELGTTDLEAGTGQAAKAGDCLVVKYYGTLATTGALFDENFTKTSAFAFTLGGGQVIKGWDQGMVGLKVGGTRRLTIPASLGYGDQANGDKIPANSDLVFVVKLLRIQKS